MRTILAFLLMVAAAQAGGPNWFSPKPPIPNPSNSTGLKLPNHVPDAGKKVEPVAPVKPVKLGPRLKFHHSLKDCAPCLPVAEWVKKHAKAIIVPVEDVAYPDLQSAAEAGWPVPTFELVNSRGETLGWRYFSWEGKHKGNAVCPGCLNAWIQATRDTAMSFDDQPNLTAAKPATLPIRSQVSQAFAVLKQAKIGTFSAAIHSNDGKRSVRVMGGNQTAISILAVCGSSGSFVLDAPGSLIPDGRLDFGYRMSGPNRGELNIRVPFDLDPSPKAAAVKQACGFGPFEILSAFTTIFKILNASAEVALPADIALTGSFTGSRIAAEFVQGKSPLVVINHLWTTERRFVGAEATESEAVIRSTVPFKKTVRVLFR